MAQLHVKGNQDTPDMSMAELTGLRDRDRYPSLNVQAGPTNSNNNINLKNGNVKNGRTMSILSISSGFDTTLYTNISSECKCTKLSI